jgi:hypothetical protein
VSLSVQKGTITSPGSTGNQTYSLPSNFDPKALMLWATYKTAAGLNLIPMWSEGFATYDGATVQQGYNSMVTNNNVGTSEVGGGLNTTACLKGLTCTSTTVATDYEVRFVSFSTGATSNFVLNWFDLPTTASIIIHYLVLGGSDITAARCGQFAIATAVATQNVTVNTGFGKPDLILASIRSAGTAAVGDTAANVSVGLSAGSATQSRQTFYQNNDATTTEIVGEQQTSHFLVSPVTNLSGPDFAATLSAQGSWPTDGFQLSFSDTAAVASPVIYMALKGTFLSSMGTVLSSTSAAVDYNAGFAPTGAIVWGMSWTSTTALITGDAGSTICGSFGIGASDGTNAGYSGIAHNDAESTMIEGASLSTTKGWQTIEPPTVAGNPPTLIGEVDLSFTGNNVRFTWSDPDTLATREINVLALGGAPAAAQVIPNVVMAPPMAV